MLFRTVLIASLFVMLLFGQTTQAEPPLKITDVFVDFDAGQFIITGQNFGTNPVVTLNCCGDPTPFELDIVGTPTATEIVAEFPSELMEGDVLLSVSTNNKLTNGTFDTNLDGWTIDGSTTTGVTGDSGTARIGQPGTPGIAVFSQRFDITKKKVLISFDYEWQAVQPSTEDVFMVELIYESTSRPVITELLLQGSDSANFNTPASYQSHCVTRRHGRRV